MIVIEGENPHKFQVEDDFDEEDETVFYRSSGPEKYMFELVYGTTTVLVGPCTGEDRDELIALWGREPDFGRCL